MVNLNKTRTLLGFILLYTEEKKMLFTWQKEGKLWDRKGVGRANHNESNIHGIRVDHFWNPAGISLAESLSEEKTSLG